MKNRLTIMSIILIFVLLLMVIVSEQNSITANPDAHLIPSLPRPIAEETILITSAGQSTDTYIVKDIANKLKIHTLFMPQATTADLEDVNTIVFVIGYSELSEKVNQLSLESELDRISALLDQALINKSKIISVFIGGIQRRSDETDLFIDQIAYGSNYIIATSDSDFDHMISDMARVNDIPLTLVDEITDISEPFASAFR